MDWHTLLLYGLAASGPLMVLVKWALDRVPDREQKQTWWEREVRGLRERVTELERDLAEKTVRIATLEHDHTAALVKLARAIIERDEARDSLKKQVD